MILFFSEECRGAGFDFKRCVVFCGENVLCKSNPVDNGDGYVIILLALKDGEC